MGHGHTPAEESRTRLASESSPYLGQEDRRASGQTIGRPSLPPQVLGPYLSVVALPTCFVFCY